MNWKIGLFLCFSIYSNQLVSGEEYLQENQMVNLFYAAVPLEESQIALLNNIASQAAEYFSIGQLQEALKGFDFVFNTLVENHYSNDFLLGTALWGRLLCHAY